MHCMIVIIGFLQLTEQGMQEKRSDASSLAHPFNSRWGCLGFPPYGESG